MNSSPKGPPIDAIDSTWSRTLLHIHTMRRPNKQYQNHYLKPNKQYQTHYLKPNRVEDARLLSTKVMNSDTGRLEAKQSSPVRPRPGRVIKEPVRFQDYVKTKNRYFIYYQELRLERSARSVFLFFFFFMLNKLSFAVSLLFVSPFTIVILVIFFSESSLTKRGGCENIGQY